jgi:hypothetical protein
MHAIPEPIVIDARAKIIWGESPEKVLTFLQSKGVGDKEAFGLIEELQKERAASIRADGIKKTWVGVLFVLAPVAYYFASMYIGYWSLKFFAALIVLGAVGLAKITNGLSMVLRPRAVTGDLANAES